MGGVRRSTWYLFTYLCTGLFVVLPLRGNGLIKSKRTKQKLYFATPRLCGSAREMEIEKEGGSSWYNLS